ncbi:GntR family transcriptional regulator [Thermodesulfobacteriota bacterium]
MEMKKIVSVSEYLADHLRTEIIMGSLKPGEKIKEYQLAENLEVSRSILREVLRTLESERLVDTIPRKGSYVSTISLEDFIELYEIREMIECMAIDLLKSKKIRVIPKIDQVLKKEIGLKVPSPEASSMEFLEFSETGLAFHSLLINSAGNKRLSQYYQGIQYNLLRYHVFQGSENLEVKTRVDHSELVARLEKGQYEKAKKYLQDHIKSHAEIIINNIEFREKRDI